MAESKIKANIPAPSFAVLRFSSLGDVVLVGAFPNLLDCFIKAKTAITPSEQKQPAIIFFTFPEFSNLLTGNPSVSKVIEVPRYRGIFGLWKFVSHLNQEFKNHHCDFVFDLQSSLRTRVARLFLPIPFFVFPKKRLRRFFFFLGFKTLGDFPTSIIEQYEKFLQRSYTKLIKTGKDDRLESGIEVLINERKKKGALTSSPQLLDGLS